MMVINQRVTFVAVGCVSSSALMIQEMCVKLHQRQYFSCGKLQNPKQIYVCVCVHTMFMRIYVCFCNENHIMSLPVEHLVVLVKTIIYIHRTFY